MWNGHAAASPTIDYNVVYAPNSNIAFDGGSSNTTDSWATWQGFGYDLHGVNANPQYTSPGTADLTIPSASPAHDAGVTIATVTTDILGVARPQGAAYDMGAYEVSAAVRRKLGSPSMYHRG
jgi:hypothetical protein